MLALGIGVSVRERFARSMRQITPEAKWQAYGADLGRDKIIQRLDFFEVRAAAARQFLSFRADGSIWRRAFTLQRSVPKAHILPILKCGDLHGRNLRLGDLFFLLRTFRLARQAGAFPLKDAPLSFVGNHRIGAGLGFQFDCAIARQANFELFVEHDGILQEVMLEPELTWCERSRCSPGNVICQRVAWSQSWHCKLLLPVIGISRRA